MNTEHVFQIGISIDDQAIREATLAQAAKTLSEEILNTCFKNQYGYRRGLSDETLEIVEKNINRVVEKQKDQIINAVVEGLVEKISRSKAFKDATKEVIDKV